MATRRGEALGEVRHRVGPAAAPQAAAVLRRPPAEAVKPWWDGSGTPDAHGPAWNRCHACMWRVGGGPCRWDCAPGATCLLGPWPSQGPWTEAGGLRLRKGRPGT